MSRIGKMPIIIPDKIQVEQLEGRIVAKGDKGSKREKQLRKKRLAKLRE